MDIKVFQKFREIVYENSGISLNETKEAMVSSRISKRMRILGIDDYKRYLQYLLDDKTGDEITKFLDVISTNVTSFFRENEHFEFLGELISAWVAQGKKRVRIWSAAASTGEEPYSIAMTILLAAGTQAADMRILATDISTKALTTAREGVYSDTALSNVPDSLKDRFFLHKKNDNQTMYIAKEYLRRMIVYKRLNLAKPPFPMRGQIDVVLCRNVMIYFDRTIRARLVAEIYRLLNPGGYLMTGHAESLTSLKTDFICLRPSIYQKSDA